MRPAARALVPLVLLVAGVTPAVAQTYVRRHSVFGQAGFANVYDEEGSLGRGYYGGGGLGYRFHRRFGADFDLFRFKHSRNVGQSRFAGTGTYVTGNLLAYLSSGPVQPYLVGGLGAFRYSNRSNTQPVASTSSTRLAGTAGFGIQAFVTQRVSVRPEVRLTIGGAKAAGGIEPPISALRISLGVGYHF